MLPARCSESGPANMTDAGSPARYEIRIKGVVPAAWFDGLQVNRDRGQTVICDRFADQPALHRLLARIRDLGSA